MSRLIKGTFLFAALVSLAGQVSSQIAKIPEVASPAEDGQWTMPTKDHANSRFSGLDQINKGNVGQLQVAIALSTGTTSGNESSPLVIGSTLYFVTPYPNILYAVDLAAPGGAVKWKFEPNPNASAQGAACCEAVNRGPTYADGTVYYNSIDNNTIALDAETGALKWRTVLGDFNKGETMTMAPFVVKDKVLVGNSGAEFGARGWVTALNAKDGSIAWRAYATGPDSDVLIDPATFKPFYDQYKGKDLGVTQWPVDAWKTGGGTMWGWMSYDPEQNLVFHGTSNPSPWNHEIRPGDNHWTNGLFAREPETGRARWFYQFSPHDLWDHSGINENIVMDLPWNGAMRKVVVRPERNGYIYVIDRTSGEVLAADPFVFINASHGVDLKTGRLAHAEEKIPTTGKVTRNVCPVAPGAKDWSPSAFSKVTGHMYIPFNNLCMDWQPTEVNYIAGTPYIGVDTKFYRGPGGHGGGLFAWDPVQRKKVWEIKERWPVWGGVVATAGGLAFYGDVEGWFKAVDVDTGQVLWRFQTGSGIIGQPTTFRGPDGRQYVAILSGIGGWIGSMVSKDLDARDPTAQKGFANMTGDLKALTRKGGMLYVFALPR
ncbi:PQQ-dependent dehydrogenase, methanol/ethanol family [Rhodospirillales bacterium URHD0017]|nr:PQQ-dependent dehydrogenase, methanol/ethanol family [Rhodospirillales bacterium URHD0017]